jgi:TrmH family RNA methyltransferase
MNPIKTLKIESPDNALFKDLKRSHDAKSMKKSGLFMLSGQKLVLEAIYSKSDKTKAGTPIKWRQLVIRHQRDLSHFPFELPEDVRVAEMAYPIFKELDIMGTDFPLLFGELPETQKWELSDLKEPQGFEVVLPLSDPLNLGAAIRVLTGFNVNRILLTSEAAHHFHPKSLRTSSGTSLYAPIFRGPSLNEVLDSLDHQKKTSTQIQKKNTTGTDYGTAVLDFPGENIFSYSFPKNFRLIVGEEGKGINPDYSGTRLAIPINQQVESLNAVTALTVALTLFMQQQGIGK